VQLKKAHPDKLIAMQVGDFFEFAGWDAVLAIEAIGLNGMGLGAPLYAATCVPYLPIDPLTLRSAHFF
jgi:DNA mismatch repair ATPase MutS